MSSRQVIFINRFYWPEKPATGQLLTDLAEELAARGQTVTVVTSGLSALPRSETHRGVGIHRLRSARSQSSGAAAKALAWTGFSIAALWWLFRRLNAGDTVVLMTDPPLLSLFAGPMARMKGARVIHWVQDVYPELPMILGGGGWLRPLRWLRNREWIHATDCVALGPDMRDLMKRQGLAPARITVIENWAPLSLAPANPAQIANLRRKRGLEGKFAVVYSGNLGRVHELEGVIRLAARLQDEPGLQFLFIGEGAQLSRLQSLATAQRLPNVRFLPSQNRGDLAASLGAADVHLVTLREGCEALVFPSKFYGILAAARPVFYIGPTQAELARRIQTDGIGAAFARDELDAMAEELKRWHRDPPLVARMSERAADISRQYGGLASAANLWQKLLSATDTNPAANS
ncbi:MAG TPA: glycosyltransferase family 4 protein [Opitutaceae bacterium]|nr:glycosyltransferase family 4 protein [Opitutaceae bacterium]HRJ45735.1 glycosyltransferase family 4 protein [Opitutaceae bacterium]